MNQKPIRAIQESNSIFFNVLDALGDVDQRDSNLWRSFVRINEESTVITKNGYKSELRQASCDMMRSSWILVDLASVKIINNIAMNLTSINILVVLQQ